MNEMVTGQDIVPMDLMQRAITSGADVGVLEKLMGLQERWEANQARKAFDNALSAAKAEFPKVLKNRRVDFKSAKGHTQYNYEDLAGIAETIGPALGKHGLSYRWRTTSISAEQVTVTCIVAHRDGHSEENSLTGSHDASGNKNSIQALGSAVTYLQRYTVKAAFGLAASEDDDGRGGEPASSGDEYAARWQVLIENATSADDLKIKWNAEKLMRNNLEWRGATHAYLKDAVTRRIDQLTPKPDIQTQRLTAEDA